MEKASFKIKGLDCSEEVMILKKVFADEKGIESLEFNVLAGKMDVVYNPDLMDSGRIIGLVASSGMKAYPWQSVVKEQFWARNGRNVLTLLSGLFLVTGMLLHFFKLPGSDPLYLLSILSGIFYVAPKAYFSLRSFTADMNLLLILAVGGALAINQWVEGAAVAFLFAVAGVLEKWSLRRAQNAIMTLLDLAPKMARVLNPVTLAIEEKKVEDVTPGSLILIRPGDKIPLDATVRKGSSSVNQAPITGESMPVHKEEGDLLYAGTINEEGALHAEVTKPYQESTLAKMIKLVDEARSKRGKSESFVETFAKYYTPLMLLLALLFAVVPPLLFGAEWSPWVYRGLVLLVIACPCALVISTPVTLVSGLTSAAANGVLIKGGLYLEEIGKIKALALDKTGTLTYGRPVVQRIIPLGDHSEATLIAKGAALEKNSEHPLARAILKVASEKGIAIEEVEDYKTFKGKGAEGQFRGKLFWIGSHRFMHEKGQETKETHEKALELEDAGHSIVAIGTADHVCGLFSIADQPREFLKDIIQAIKASGVEEIALLTGDNKPSAQAIAKFAGIDSFQAELLPEDKVKAIEQLKAKWKSVAMCGDGVNDAAALTTATVGIAMGGMGSDAAIETADIALMTDDLSKIPWLMRHSRKTMRVILQNISFSIAVKVIVFGLAIFNMATLWMAIAADTGATVLVVFNALRLLRVTR